VAAYAQEVQNLQFKKKGEKGGERSSIIILSSWSNMKEMRG